MDWAFDKLPSVPEAVREIVPVETTVKRLQDDMAYMVAYTAVLVRSTRPELRMLVNTARGQIVPAGKCTFTDGTTAQMRDIGMPQVNAPLMTVEEIIAELYRRADELGLTIT